MIRENSAAAAARKLLRNTGTVLLVIALAAITQAAAAPAWNLTDSSFQKRPVQLQSIDTQGLHLAAADSTQPSLTQWEDVLEISGPGAPSHSGGKLALYLIGGDRVSGDPVTVADEKLGWEVPGIGHLDLPLEKLQGIASAAAPMPPDLDNPRTDDVVQLVNGDQTHGIVTQIAPGGVTIQAGAATPTLAWDSIAAVLFSTPPPSPHAGDRAFRIRLADNSSLTAQTVSLDGDQLTFSLNGKTSHTLSLAQVWSIEQVNGPVSWLTSHRPVENIYKPYFQENFPTRFDRTVDGKLIGEKYPDFHHGLGCHSYSKISYDLDGSYGTFRAQYAIDSESPLADVTLRILLDDKPALERKNVKFGQVYPVISVPLGSAKKLSLEVDYGENYATEDRFIWLDPALVRGQPADAH